MADILNFNGKNHHRDSPYAAWIVVCQGGRTLIGLPHEDGRVVPPTHFLSPVFEVQDFILPTPQGPFAGMNLRPFLGWESCRRLPISEDAFLTAFLLADLDKEDFKGISAALENCQERAKQMRTQKSGLTLAHNIPEGIKPPGER